MNVQVKQGSIQESDADTIIVNLFEGVTAPGGATGAVDQALAGAVSELIASGDLTGKAGEVTVLYPREVMAAKRVLVAGMGSRDEYDLEGVRQTAAAAMKRARELNAKSWPPLCMGQALLVYRRRRRRRPPWKAHCWPCMSMKRRKEKVWTA
ncbi:MAG: hypothetical protein M5U34_10750 [Chloroflexi bacterium]|nr:hypothetical protein [Chloroflexota bacterium]